jgi:hypothetical protein
MAKEAQIVAVIPTAINTLTVVHQNVVTNLLRKQVSDVELPSMYKRAFMMTYETGELYTTDDLPADE